MRKSSFAGLVAGAFVFAATLAGGSTLGETEAQPGDTLTVGAEAPSFSLPAVGGDTLGTEQVRGEKNLVLVFFRGAW